MAGQQWCHAGVAKRQCLIFSVSGAILWTNLELSPEVFMFGFGMPELIIILVIVLVVFGAGRLPEIGGALGKSIRNFKRASDGKDEIEIKPKKDEETKKEG
jgi:sec-independent protein translocase protein TatA